jgi:hypothetical protein
MFKGTEELFRMPCAASSIGCCQSFALRERRISVFGLDKKSAGKNPAEISATSKFSSLEI